MRMVNNNQSVSIKLKPGSIRDIESFVDTICDQLFINNTYYGNILMATTELFNYLLENNHHEDISVAYNSDYKTMAISFQYIDLQLISKLTGKIDIDQILNQSNEQNIFLIQSLVDNISMENNDTISLEFDISALHNEIYNHRASVLHKYFSNQKSLKVQKEND